MSIHRTVNGVPLKALSHTERGQRGQSSQNSSLRPTNSPHPTFPPSTSTYPNASQWEKQRKKQKRYRNIIGYRNYSYTGLNNPPQSSQKTPLPCFHVRLVNTNHSPPPSTSSSSKRQPHCPQAKLKIIIIAFNNKSHREKAPSSSTSHY